MRTIVKCTSKDYLALAEIWERSVRATHDFLTESDIAEIKAALIPLYFPNVDIYSVKDDNDQHVGFIGLSGDKIEMLFIDSASIGCGYGSILLDYAKEKRAVYVDVNEQNLTALNFYIKKGFNIINRDETDDCGRPFPILHLSILKE